MKKILYLLPLLALFSCSIDHGLGTLDSQISGKVIFLNTDQMPSYIESVRVVAVVNMPPQNLGDVVITNTSVNLSKTEPTYYIPAPIASYDLVAAIYKEKGKAWNYANILGFYGFDPVNFLYDYKKVVLTRSAPIARDIDIYCDWSLLRPENRQSRAE
jgi:hypothetical protein